MRQAVPLFLEDDTVEHLDWIAEQLAKQRNMSVSRSDAVAWLTKNHWKKIQRQRFGGKSKPKKQLITAP